MRGLRRNTLPGMEEKNVLTDVFGDKQLYWLAKLATRGASGNVGWMSVQRERGI